MRIITSFLVTSILVLEDIFKPSPHNVGGWGTALRQKEINSFTLKKKKTLSSVRKVNMITPKYIHWFLKNNFIKACGSKNSFIKISTFTVSKRNLFSYLKVFRLITLLHSAFQKVLLR